MPTYHWMLRHRSGSICLIVGLAFSLSTAQSDSSSAQGIGPHIGVGQLIGESVGLDDGYSRYGAFLPLAMPHDGLLVFSDTHVLLYNEQSELMGANLGGGARLYNADFNRIFGGYAYYDLRESGNENYNQIGFGFETLGAVYDSRINVNLPTDTDSNQIAANTFATPAYGGSTGQNIVVGGNAFQQALRTIDLEAGAMLTGNAWMQLKGYAGAYGLYGDDISDWGARGRVELRAFDQAWISGFIQNDEVFGTTGGMWVEWRFGKTANSYCNVAARLGDPIERRRHVTLHETSLDVLATSGGTPITVLHVDSNATPGGAGGYQDPVTTLLEASNQPQDIVFVHGGSVFNGEGMDITTNGQQFLAEGTPHTIVSDQGTFLLPGVNPGGATPLINGSPGAAVTLASGNTVSGFIINNSGAQAIFANGSTAATLLEQLTIGTTVGDAIYIENQTGSITLDNVSVANAGANGIHFVNGSASVDIQDSSIDTTTFDGMFYDNFAGTVGVTDTTIDNAAGFAVSLANSTTTLNYTGGHIQNSTGAVGVVGGNNTATFATDIDVSGNVNPIGNLYFTQTDGTYDFTASTVNVTNGSGLVVTNSDANYNFDDVVISGPTGRIVLQDNTGFFTFGDVDISTNSSFTSASLADSNSATFNSLLINNTAGGGLFIDNTDTVIGNGNITSTEGAAVAIFDSTIDITFSSVTTNEAATTPITLTNTTGAGFAITGNGVTPGSGGLLELDFADTAISLTNATNVDIQFVDILGTLEDGVVAFNSTNLRFNGMFMDFVQRGIDVDESHNVEITNNTIIASNTAIEFGISLRSSVGSGSQGYDVSNNDISGANSSSGGAAGIYVENAVGPDVDVNIEGNDITITTVGPPPLPVPTGIQILANSGDVNLSGSSGAGNNTVSAVQSFFHTESGGGTVNGQIFVNGVARP